MYTNWAANLLVVVATSACVALAVVVHYEGLGFLSVRLSRLHGERRRKVLFGVYGVVALHVVEIWLFGAAIWALLRLPAAGAVTGSLNAQFFDAIYLSAETFSTVGFGDLSPMGPIRFLTGTEALTGFILITWSASFLYLEMQQFWKRA